MAIRQLYCSQQALTRRGDESYEAQLHSKVETDNHGWIRAIAFEVNTRAIKACVGFRQNSDAQV